MKKGADVDAIEEVLRIVMAACPRANDTADEAAHEEEIHEPENSVEKQTPIFAGEQVKETSKKKSSDRLLNWITKLSSLEKFDLMLRFANKDLIDHVKSFVISKEDASAAVREKFSV